MNYQDFCNHVMYKVKDIMGNEYEVSLIKADKVNGITFISLTILKKGETVAPNIYLESYYSEYENGVQLSLIVDNIVSFYYSVDKKPILPTFLLSDFDNVKDRLYCKLINYNKNISLLSAVPHIKWMDLAIIFCVLVSNDPNGISSITVKFDLFEQWGVTVETIYATALTNTPLLFEPTVKSMDDIISSLVSEQPSWPNDCESFDEIIMDMLQQNKSGDNRKLMFVAGNILGIYGASWLLQKDELNDISNSLDGNLFILPSSIHEVIIIPFTKEISTKNLLQMVCAVNATQVSPEDFLSDNVYLYTRENDTLLPLF